MNDSDILKFVLTLIESGNVYDPASIQFIENVTGQKLNVPQEVINRNLGNKTLGDKPQGQSAPAITTPIVSTNGAHGLPKTMPVVKTELPGWMDRSLTYKGMYKMATDEVKEKMNANVMLEKKNLSSDLMVRYKDWCTPELFDYLSMKGPRAEGELRAALWPLPVAFAHQAIKADGRIWMVPNITILLDNAPDGNLKMGEEGFPSSQPRFISFYCTKNREIRGIFSDPLKIFDVPNKDQKDAVKKAAYDYYNKSNAELVERFVNPSTGKEQYVVVKHAGTQGYAEKKRGGNYTWCEWRDLTNFHNGGAADYDGYWAQFPQSVLDEVEKKGREAISDLRDMLLDTKGLEFKHFTGRHNANNELVWEGWDSYERPGSKEAYDEWNQMEAGFEW